MDVFIPTNATMLGSYRDIQYKSIKMITGIRSNANKDSILNHSVGGSFRCFTADQIKSKMTGMGIENGYLCDDCPNHHHKGFDEVPQLETLIKRNATDIFKVKTNTFLKGWRKSEGKWSRIQCTCGENLKLDHITSCHHQTKNKADITTAIREPLSQFLNKVKDFVPIQCPKINFFASQRPSDTQNLDREYHQQGPVIKKICAQLRQIKIHVLNTFD